MADFFAGGYLRFLEGEWRDEDGDVVDVAEVKHGRYDDDYCTVCGAAIPTDDKDDFIMKKEVNFCYSCGAKMIKE